jgi:hypothetical protein
MSCPAKRVIFYHPSGFSMLRNQPFRSLTICGSLNSAITPTPTALYLVRSAFYY